MADHEGLKRGFTVQGERPSAEYVKAPATTMSRKADERLMVTFRYRVVGLLPVPQLNEVKETVPNGLRFAGKTTIILELRLDIRTPLLALVREMTSSVSSKSELGGDAVNVITPLVA